MLRGGRGGGGDLDKVIRIGGMLYQLHRARKSSNRGIPQQPRRVPQAPRVPTYPQPRTYPAPQPQPPMQYPAPSQQSKPGGYDYISVAGKTMRLDPANLPLTINPGRSDRAQTIQKAVDLWNRAGVGQLFAVTQGPADITVDWSGSSVSPGARAETRMRTSSRVVVPTSISVKEGGRSQYHLARVMTHELGHVLGLDHSNDRDDIMYRSEGGTDLILSERDVKMVRWLYAQNDYVPVIGATKNSNTGTAAFALRPASFCGHNH